MSRQTFTDWIFSWLVNLQIDFREVCSVCGENPPVLAGDGTKIGFFFSHAKLDPIEKPDLSEGISPLHRRTNRQFFSYSLKDNAEYKKNHVVARHCLAYYVAKNSSKLNEFAKATGFKVIADLSEEEKKGKVISCAPPQLRTLLSRYISVDLDQNVIKGLSSILGVLSTEVPLSSLVNFRLLDALSGVISNPSSFHLIRDDLPEIHNLLQAARLSGEEDAVNELIMYLIDEIRRLHADDRAPADIGIVRHYNPEKQGRAYYFTSHGGQLRKMPKYLLTEDKNVDGTQCRKIFPEAAKSGTTYLYLIFDPAHYGHCYGFHIITSSEGRKDAFSPPFLYMEQAPRDFFYDFSCQLEEYCLNREPMYWRETRFWHDIFHGYSHKCPFVYSSRRLHHLHANNTEICEQFNSYIQKIKYSARSMNQVHFIFYLQFFIHKWNEIKRCEYEKQLTSARKLSQ
jgi:hypothetical protein